MQRCVLGATQNQNESFNALIWGRCPKAEFHSAAVVEIATYLALPIKPVFENLSKDSLMLGGHSEPE